MINLGIGEIIEVRSYNPDTSEEAEVVYVYGAQACILFCGEFPYLGVISASSEDEYWFKTGQVTKVPRLTD